MRTSKREFLKSIVLIAAGFVVAAGRAKDPKGEWHSFGLYVDENGRRTYYIDDIVWQEGDPFPVEIARVDMGSDSELEDIECDQFTLDVDFRVEPGQPLPDRLVGVT